MRGLIEETRTDPPELPPSRLVDPLLSDCPARRRSCTGINFVGSPIPHPRPSIQLQSLISRYHAVGTSSSLADEPKSNRPQEPRSRGRHEGQQDIYALGKP